MNEKENQLSKINLWEYLSGKSTQDLAKDLIQIIFADRRFVEAIKYYIEHKVIGERGGYYWTDDELRSYLNELHLYELIRKLFISTYEYQEIETKKRIDTRDEKQELLNSIFTDVELLENILYHDQHNWLIGNPKHRHKEAREYLNLRYNTSELRDLIIRDGKERRDSAWYNNINVMHKSKPYE